MRRATMALLALAALLLMGGAALAQVSTHYDLSWHVVAGGGGRSASAGHTLQGTAGQAATGWMASGGHQLSAGFRLPRAGPGPTPPPPQERLYLPLVLRSQ